MAMLDITGLDAYYGRAHILQGVAFSMNRGEVLALMGRNGAGKSTTMKAVMGLVPPAGGGVSFEGKPVQGREPFEIARLGIGYVPEDRRVFSELTVMENLSVAQRPPRPTRRTGRRSGSSRSSPISGACATGRAGQCRAASSRC